MARIFISHSSRDNTLAAGMIAWLQQNGFQHVFLDFDKHGGIAVGDDWERRLYAELDRSHAMVVIVTPNWHQSKWTWSEFTQARALGKAIFPVIEVSGEGQLVSPDIQHIDLTLDREMGLDQLRRRLTEVAMEGQRGFSWNPNRPAFPGLLSFEEEDAAVYFGRDDEARRLIERLNARRSQGGARLVALLGASGSGKSSLLRAAVLPHLKKWGMPLWIVLPPFRPQLQPVNEFVTSIVSALGGTRSSSWVQQQLRSGSTAQGLTELAQELRLKTGYTEAQVLIPVDQAEELFTISNAEQRAQFFTILNAALAPHLPFLAVMALRSDYLGHLQSVEPLRLNFEEFSLSPLALSKIPAIIEGPARVAGMRVDDELVLQAVQDAQTEDALPLLAFTLRELVDRHGGDGHLSIQDYAALGDPAANVNPLENAVRRAADWVLVDAQPSAGELRALREAFVPALVRVNDRDEYVRNSANIDALPAASRTLIHRLATARLLVMRQEGQSRIVEIAHESLLRKWPLLRGWLDEEREFLIGKKHLEADVAEWEKTDAARKVDALLTGIKLERARAWMIDHPTQLSKREREFIQASIGREGEERQRRQREREFAERQLTLQSGVLADYARTQAAAGNHAIAVLLALEGLPDEQEGVIRPYVEEVRQELASALYELREQTIMEGHFSNYGIPKFTPDGSRLVTWEASGPIRLWNLSGQCLVAASKPDKSGHSACSQDSSRVAVWFEGDRTVALWDARTGAIVSSLEGHTGDIESVAFTHDSKIVLTGSKDCTIRVWEATTGTPRRTIKTPDTVLRLCVGPNSSSVLALPYVGQNVMLLNWESGNLLAELPPRQLRSELEYLFSPDGSQLLVVEGKVATLRDSGTGAGLITLTGHADAINAASFDPEGSRVVTSSDDKTIRVWDVSTGELKWLADKHDRSVKASVFSGDGTKVLSATGGDPWESSKGNGIFVRDALTGNLLSALNAASDQALAPFFSQIFTYSDKGATRIVTFRKSRAGHRSQVLWDTANGTPVGEFDQADVSLQEFTPDGTFLIAVSRDRSVHVMSASTGKDVLVLRGHRQLHPDVDASGDAVLSPDGRHVATWIWDNTVRIWNLWGTATSTGVGVVGGSVEQVTYLPDDDYRRALVSVSRGRRDDHQLKLLDLKDDAIVATQPIVSPHFLKLTSDSRLALVQIDAHNLQLFPTNSLQPKRRFGPFEANIRSFGFLNAERHIAVFLEDGILQIADVSSGTTVVRFSPEGQTFKQFDALTDAGVVITIDGDGCLSAWNAYENRVIVQLRLPERPHDVRVAANDLLVTVFKDRRAAIWDMTNGRQLSNVTGFMDLSADGEELLTYGDVLAVRAMRNDSVSATLSAPSVVTAAFIVSTDRILILQDMVDRDKAVFVLWDRKSGKTTVLLEDERVQYSIDQLDRSLIRISRGAAEWAWQTESGKEHTPKPIHRYGPGFKKDIRTRFLTSDDRVIHAMMLEIVREYHDLQSLIEKAKTALPRSLTPEERKVFNLDPRPPRWYSELRKWPHNGHVQTTVSSAGAWGRLQSR